MANKKKNLYYLNELSGYKVESDDPDVRGWKVKDADNRVIGTVDNLLVNKEKEKVVYLDVEVDKSIIDANHEPYSKSASSDAHEFINKEGENHLIIPVGHVRLNEDDKYVYTDKIDHRTFAETKRKERGAEIDRDYEVVVLESYSRDNRAGTTERASQPGNRKDTPGIERSTNTRATGSTVASSSTERDLDTGREERERRTTREGDLDEKRRTEGRVSDDDTFYDQEDFDRSNYRQRK